MMAADRAEGTDLDRAEALVREAFGADNVAPALAYEERILDRFGTELQRCGVVGEEKLTKLTYLVVTSRLLDQPVSLAVKGPSAGGKSYTIDRVLEFFPDGAYYELSAMSEHALAYSKEPLVHRMLVLYEAAGLGSDFASYLMRSLLSEGQVRYETVDKTKEGMKARLIERPGPTGLIVTTTAVKLHPENETRLLSIVVNDTREQTRSVLLGLTAEALPVVDLEAWRDLQRWLADAEHRVNIPFAPALAGLVPPVAVRLRRDFGDLLNLIRAHAVIHQATRHRDDQGRIVANLKDYEVVRDLVADIMAEGVEATVPRSVRQTVEAVELLTTPSETTANLQTPAEVNVAAVARELKLDTSAAYRRVQNAIARGYLENLEDRERRPARLRLGNSLPEDEELLPTVDGLAEVCTFADTPEGVM